MIDAANHFATGPDLSARLDMAAVHAAIWRRFQGLLRGRHECGHPVRVEFTEVDPYADAAPMRSEWRSGTLYVYAGENECMPRDIHLALRAVHDSDHCHTGGGFDAAGEWHAVRYAANREPQLACLWSSEILGQVCTYFARGTYPAHRLVAGMNRWMNDLTLTPEVRS